MSKNQEVDFLIKGGYNNFEPCFNDKINFEKDNNVKKAIKTNTANFVRIIEPTNIEEFNEVVYGELVNKVEKINGFYDIKAHGSYNSIKLFEKPASAETVARIL